MGKTKESPRYCVVSMRVTEEEKQELQELANYRREHVSDTLRHAKNKLLASILPRT